jgi:four helix bundle protein
MARGSLSETKSHLILSQRLGFITQVLYDKFLLDYRNLSVKLNDYIRVIGKRTAGNKV